MAAQPFSVETEAVRSTSRTAAIVEGTVVDWGRKANYRFLYAPAKDEWCSSQGHGGEVSTTPAEPVTGEEVQGELSELTQGTEYCVALEAREGEGEGSGRGQQLYFTAGAPSVGIPFPEATSPTTAQLDVEVDPAAQATEYRVRYGAASSEWCESEGLLGAPAGQTGWQALSPEAASSEYLEAAVGGLEAGGEYCAAVALKNESAEAESEQAYFTSGAPFALALDARAKSSDAELIEGYVAPAGQPTSYWVDYGPASSPWCASEGEEGEAPQQTSAASVNPAEGSLQQVTPEVAGLKPGERYCAVLVAKNATASARSAPFIEFTAGLPSVVALEATPISREAADVSATVETAGQPTSYRLLYGEANEPPCVPSPTTAAAKRSRSARARLDRTRHARKDLLRGTSAPAHAGAPYSLLPGPSALGAAQGEFPAAEEGGYSTIEVEISELHAGSEYCVQLYATNAAGETSSEEAEESETFFIAGAPTTRTQEDVAVTQTTALVKGEVQSAEQETGYWLQYGPAGSRWCLTGGAAGSPQAETPELKLAPGSNQFEHVQVELAGLNASGEYCARFAAKNESGEAPPSQPADFTTRPPALAPTTSTAPVTKVAVSTATIEGAVNPGNAHTSYRAAYGLQSSQWCQSGGAQGSPEHLSPPATLPAEDGEAHAVAVEVGALSAATEYCAAISAANSVGESKPSAPARFKTASQKGGGGVLGEEEHKEPEAKPQVGSQAEVGTVSGTVTVKLKGTSRYAPLGPGALISDGSEIEATNGRVRLTVSLPDGKTQTAEAFGGRFQIEQEKNGFTKLVLTLALTGCPRQTLPKGSASAASILRNQPLKRHLWVTEKGGKWGTNGRFVSTSVEGTTWLTTDECKRSIVFLKEGRLKVRNLVTKKTKLLTAGHSYIAKDPRKRHHKRRHRR